MASVFHQYWNENSPGAQTVLASYTLGTAATGTYEFDIYAYAAGTLSLLSDADNIGAYYVSPNQSINTLICRVPMPATINLPPVRITTFAALSFPTDRFEVRVVGGASLLSTYRGLVVGRGAQF